MSRDNMAVAVDSAALAALAAELGADAGLTQRIAEANTTALAFEFAGNLPLAATIATRAHAVAMEVLGEAPIALEVLLIDRDGHVIAAHPAP
jgi:cobalt-precorrin-5B (C1)-methyltransferase